MQRDFENLNQAFIEYYLNQHANIPLLFYETEFPVDQCFIQLALSPEYKQQQQEEQFAKQMYGANREEGNQPITPSAYHESQSQLWGSMYECQEDIHLDQIFTWKSNETQTLSLEEPQRLLITGRAAIGKTTLCQYLAYQWAQQASDDANENIPWLEDFPAVIWVRLRELVNYTDDECTIANVVHQSCIEELRQDDFSLEEIQQYLKEHREQLLFLLDGFDEVSSWIDIKNKNHNDYKKARLLRQLVQLPWVIITTRHYATRGLMNIHRRLDIVGFSSENVINYVYLFFKTLKKPKYSQGLIDYLGKQTSAFGVAHVPLILEIICSLWERYQSNNQPMPEKLTLAQLYTKLVVEIIRRHLVKHFNFDTRKIKAYTDLEILQHPLCIKHLTFLSQLAWQGLRKGEFLISLEVLFHDFCAKHSISAEEKADFIRALLAMGLIKGIGTYQSNVLAKKYFFIRVTFQEYLASMFLARNICESNDDVQSWQQLCFNERYNPRHEFLCIFITGIINQRYPKQLAGFLSLLFSRNNLDMTGIYHIELLMRCLEETSLSDPEITNLQDQCKTQLDLVVLLESNRERIVSTLNSCPRLCATIQLDTLLIDNFKQLKSACHRFTLLNIIGQLNVISTKMVEFLQTLLKSDSTDSDLLLKAFMTLYIALQKHPQLESAVNVDDLKPFLNSQRLELVVMTIKILMSYPKHLCELTTIETLITFAEMGHPNFCVEVLHALKIIGEHTKEPSIVKRIKNICQSLLLKGSGWQQIESAKTLIVVTERGDKQAYFIKQLLKRRIDIDRYQASVDGQNATILPDFTEYGRGNELIATFTLNPNSPSRILARLIKADTQQSIAEFLISQLNKFTTHKSQIYREMMKHILCAFCLTNYYHEELIDFSVDCLEDNSSSRDIQEACANYLRNISLRSKFLPKFCDLIEKFVLQKPLSNLAKIVLIEALQVQDFLEPSLLNKYVNRILLASDDVTAKIALLKTLLVLPPPQADVIVSLKRAISLADFPTESINQFHALIIQNVCHFISDPSQLEIFLIEQIEKKAVAPILLIFAFKHLISLRSESVKFISECVADVVHKKDIKTLLDIFPIIIQHARVNQPLRSNLLALAKEQHDEELDFLLTCILLGSGEHAKVGKLFEYIQNKNLSNRAVNALNTYARLKPDNFLKIFFNQYADNLAIVNSFLLTLTRLDLSKYLVICEQYPQSFKFPKIFANTDITSLWVYYFKSKHKITWMWRIVERLLTHSQPLIIDKKGLNLNWYEGATRKSMPILPEQLYRLLKDCRHVLDEIKLYYEGGFTPSHVVRFSSTAISITPKLILSLPMSLDGKSHRKESQLNKMHINEKPALPDCHQTSSLTQQKEPSLDALPVAPAKCIPIDEDGLIKIPFPRTRSVLQTGFRIISSNKIVNLPGIFSAEAPVASKTSNSLDRMQRKLRILSLRSTSHEATLSRQDLLKLLKIRSQVINVLQATQYNLNAKLELMYQFYRLNCQVHRKYSDHSNEKKLTFFEVIHWTYLAIVAEVKNVEPGKLQHQPIIVETLTRAHGLYESTACVVVLIALCLDDEKTLVDWGLTENVRRKFSITGFLEYGLSPKKLIQHFLLADTSQAQPNQTVFVSDQSKMPDLLDLINGMNYLYQQGVITTDQRQTFYKKMRQIVNAHSIEWSAHYDASLELDSTEIALTNKKANTSSFFDGKRIRQDEEKAKTTPVTIEQKIQYKVVYFQLSVDYLQLDDSLALQFQKILSEQFGLASQYCFDYSKDAANRISTLLFIDKQSANILLYVLKTIVEQKLSESVVDSVRGVSRQQATIINQYTTQYIGKVDTMYNH